MYACAVDVQRTIEFILQSQAKTETRLTGITKIMQQGMRMLVKIEASVTELAQAQKRTEAMLAESQKRTDARFAELASEMKELAKAQKTTERTLQAFIKGQRNGR